MNTNFKKQLQLVDVWSQQTNCASSEPSWCEDDTSLSHMVPAWVWLPLAAAKLRLPHTSVESGILCLSPEEFGALGAGSVSIRLSSPNCCSMRSSCPQTEGERTANQVETSFLVQTWDDGYIMGFGEQEKGFDSRSKDVQLVPANQTWVKTLSRQFTNRLYAHLLTMSFKMVSMLDQGTALVLWPM